MNDNNDNLIQNLIKQGKYDQVLNYLDKDGENIIKEKKNLEEDLNLLGFDEDLIKKLNNCFTGEEEDNVTILEGVDEINMNISTVRNNLDDTENRNDESYMHSVADNVNINDYDYLLNWQKKHGEDNFIGENLCVQSNTQNINPKEDFLIIQELLKKQEENVGKIAQLQEIESMREEEKYGIYYQTLYRQKLFPFKDKNLTDAASVLSNGEKDYSNRSLNFDKDFVNVNLIFEDIVKQNTDIIIEPAINKDKIKIIEEKDVDVGNSNASSKGKNSMKKLINLDIFKKKLNNISLKSMPSSGDKDIDNLFTLYNQTLLSPSQNNTPTLKIEVNFHTSLENPNLNRISQTISNWKKNYNAGENDYYSDKNIQKLNENHKNVNFKAFNKTFIDLYIGKNLNKSGCNRNSISEFEFISSNISSPTPIKKLNIEFIPLSSNLQYLSLEDNNISKIENLDICSNLTYLNLNRNNISKIENLSSNLNLEKLFLNGNNIQKIENLSRNRKLRILSIGRNKLTSIEDIEVQIPFIEELTLSENLIKITNTNNFSRDEISLPTLKYLDLNENKINLLNFFFCPNLEKLFLRDNKINLNIDDVGDIQTSLQHCPKLKEVDLSFNKIDNFSEILKLLKYNKSLEVLNLNNNPFSMNIKGSFTNFGLSMKKIFPLLKTIDNENISGSGKSNQNQNQIVNVINHDAYENNFLLSLSSSIMSTTPSINFINSYYNILNQEATFLKYFNAIYHTNNIFEKFNFNFTVSKRNIDFSKLYELVNLVNENYHLFKFSHFNQLSLLLSNENNNNVLKINSHTAIQSNFMKYIYQFKHKFEYLRNSIIGVFLRKLHQKKKLKILHSCLIQAHFRGYRYRKIYKQNLGRLKFEDEEEENDDILNFFKNKENIKIDEEKIENKIFNLDFDLMNKEVSINNLEVIPESKEESSINMTLTLDKNDFVPADSEKERGDIEIKIKNLERKVKQNEIKIKSNKSPNNNSTNNFLHHPPNQQHTSLNNLLKLSKKEEKFTHANHINYVNMSDNVGVTLPVLNKIKNSNNLRKENNSSSLTNQLPLISPSLMRYKEPSVTSSNDNISITSSISLKNSNTNASRSKSNSIAVKSTPSGVNNHHYSGSRLLPTKTIEEIKLIEEECRIAIKKAKEEWQFNTSQAQELLAKKIKKSYKKKIDKILQNLPG